MQQYYTPFMMILNTIPVLSFLCFGLLSILCIGAPQPNDDISMMRQRVLELTIWPPPANVSSTIEAAIGFNITLNSSCFWPDINYTDKTVVGPWDTYNHILRVNTILQALTVNGSTVNNNTQMWSTAHCALNVWLVNDWWNPNWWFNQIGVPLQVTGQLLMLGDNATSYEIERIKEISYRAVWWIPNSYAVGANLVNMIQCEIYRSLATNNRTGIEESFLRIWKDVVIVPVDKEGLQVDWAYKFHWSELLSGSYGLVWVNTLLLFLECTMNTKYQPNNQTLLILANFLVHGDAWMIMSTEWDWQVKGRGISSPGNGSSHGFTTDWIRSLAQLIHVEDTKQELMNFADRLDNKPNTPLLIGNKHFFTSDYQVHRRQNWIATIKVQSRRTLPTECILGQNQKAEHAGQGLLNIYRSGVNDYSAIFPVFDWQAINGITVEHGIPLETCIGNHFHMIFTKFVGGVSDSQYGMAFMDTATHNLTAKRSWHFYDDAIIALATDLKLTAQVEAWTTLASRLLPIGQISIGFFNSTIITLTDGNYSIPYMENKTSSNVQWIHVGGSDIGFLLQQQGPYASLEVEVGNKTGNYIYIGPSNYTVTARMLTLAINHGIGPYMLDYNYMILPNISLESMPKLIQQYTEESVFACQSTNDTFHGTMWPRLKRASFVLWHNGLTTFSCKSSLFEINIQLNHEGAYIYSETEKDFTITVSHPEILNTTVTVTVDRIGHGQGCTLSSYTDITTTNVTLTLPSDPNFLGASVNVTCTK